MCIEIDNTLQVIKNGRLKLWKVIRRDNQIGLWASTGWRDIKEIAGMYRLGINIAKSFPDSMFFSRPDNPGQFHCFFTRKAARRYMKHRYSGCRLFWNIKSKRSKIIRVYADSSDVVKIGRDSASDIRAISVSKMEIKSLQHRR